MPASAFTPELAKNLFVDSAERPAAVALAAEIQAKIQAEMKAKIQAKIQRSDGDPGEET